jgi:hypothetical protein
MTECLVYRDREPNMPIVLRNSEGLFIQGNCLHGTDEEFVKLSKLISQGRCSLEVSHGR